MWKKIGISFFVAILAIYIIGCFYFSKHFFFKTNINQIEAGGKTPEEIYKADQNSIVKYKITVKELDKNEVLNGILKVKDKTYYEKLLNDQKFMLWPGLFFKYYDFHNDEVYIIDENKFNQQIKSFEFLNEKRKKENAKLKYDPDNKNYKVIKEKYGNVENVDAAIAHIKEAILHKDKTVDILDYYEKPQYISDSKKFVQAKEKLDKYLTTDITFKRDDKIVKLDADSIHDFLCWNKKYKVWISKETIKDWVLKNLSKTYNTVGIKRTIHSPGSGKFTVSGGSYGCQVGIDKTTDAIVKSIKKGETDTREPEYIMDGKLDDDYVDISLAEQKLWVVKNGKVKMSSPIVSGCIATGHGTRTGVYFVEYKTTNYTMRKYNVHVDYWMPFDTSVGVGMHDASWRGSFGGSIYKNNGSHGCINMPSSKAREAYHMIPVNFPVIVHW